MTPDRSLQEARLVTLGVGLVLAAWVTIGAPSEVIWTNGAVLWGLWGIVLSPLLPILTPRAVRGVCDWIVASIATAIVLINGHTIGLFLPPVPLLMWIIAVAPLADTRPSLRRFFRVVGAVLMALPLSVVGLGLVVLGQAIGALVVLAGIVIFALAILIWRGSFVGGAFVFAIGLLMLWVGAYEFGAMAWVIVPSWLPVGAAVVLMRRRDTLAGRTQ